MLCKPFFTYIVLFIGQEFAHYYAISIPLVPVYIACILQICEQENKKNIISAIHLDDTARVQIVDEKTNPYFYKVIEYFGKITNTKVVLNTSLNKRGMPIARTPNDALNVFFTTPMDFIALENYLIEK